MTRAGAAACFGILAAGAAAAFGIPSLYVPAIALVALALGSVAWVALAARGAAVVRAPGRATVEEGALYPLAIDVRQGRIPIPGGELEDPLLGSVPLRAVQRDVRFERRGTAPLGPTRALIRDPLALAVRTVTAAPATVLVLPRVEPVVAEQHDHGRRRDSALLAANHAELELDTLRPYRPGAPASRIHWPTTARAGEMVERRLLADADARPLVVLDARSPTSAAALDRAVRATASLCVQLARAGGCALLLEGDRRAAAIDPDLRAWPVQHARLALVEPATRAPLNRHADRARAVFWVAARAGVPDGLARVAAPVRWLVTTDPLPGRPLAFTVAGCGGQRIARGALRRAA